MEAKWSLGVERYITRSDRPLPAYSPPGRLARLDHGARDAQVLGWGGLVDLSVLFLLFLDVEGRWTAGLD